MNNSIIFHGHQVSKKKGRALDDEYDEEKWTGG